MLPTFDKTEESAVGGKVSFSKLELDFVYTLGLCTTMTPSQYSAKKNENENVLIQYREFCGRQMHGYIAVILQRSLLVC